MRRAIYYERNRNVILCYYENKIQKTNTENYLKMKKI